ncbi:MAG: FkbM family methyltransferase [Desulfuromonadaceae bacterium]|nr:FkbM family methyltransferase [Desulfuromonadaceae bacterium]
MNLIKKLFNSHRKTSYSQSGEDLIVDFVFEALKIYNPDYMDIGANHPVYLNNTYLLYKRGCHGVCIEPDPSLFKVLKQKRTRDTCLNIGIGLSEQTSADFFVMSAKTLNTFSRVEAERYQSYGNQLIERIIPIALVPINSVMTKYCIKTPNFISLDVEGMDLEILKSLDLAKWRPEVFCIETLTYTEDNTETKITEIIDYMCQNGYMLYADTYINSIFVDNDKWINR